MTWSTGSSARLRDEVLVVDLRARRRTDDHTGPHARRKRNASRRLLHHDDRGRVSHQHIGDDGVVEPMIDRCHDGTELRGREQDLQERRMVGAKPADTVSPLDAELAEPVREAANPVRELTVRAAPLTVDQRGLIRRDSCSPLDPRPDSPVHHHFQGSHTSDQRSHGPNCRFKARLAPRHRRPLVRRVQKTSEMLQRLCGIEQVMAQRLRDAGWRIVRFPRLNEEDIRRSVTTDVRAVRSASLLGDAQLTSTDGQSDRHRRSSGKLCELGAVSPWSRLRPRRKSVRLNRSRDECTVNRPVIGPGAPEAGRAAR